MKINSLVNEAFGTSFKIEDLESPKNLPVYLNVRRNFYLLKDKEIKVLLVEVNEKDRFSIKAYEKQLEQYIDYFKLSIAYIFKDIKKAQRDSLIEKRIPFISETQLFLPCLGMFLNNRYLNKKVINSEKMMPVTQALYIYLSFVLKGEKVIKKEAAKFLNVTATSLTRGCDQLKSMGMISQEKIGKEHYINAAAFSYESFLKAKQFMINPIQETILIETEKHSDNLPLAGMSALEKLSMINESNIKTVAIYKNNKIFKQKLDERWSIIENVTKVELWKYDPLLFIKNGIVDPISLYMTFEKNNDERIEKELERMMVENQW